MKRKLLAWVAAAALAVNLIPLSVLATQEQPEDAPDPTLTVEPSTEEPGDSLPEETVPQPQDQAGQPTVPAEPAGSLTPAEPSVQEPAVQPTGEEAGAQLPNGGGAQTGAAPIDTPGQSTPADKAIPEEAGEPPKDPPAAPGEPGAAETAGLQDPDGEPGQPQEEKVTYVFEVDGQEYRRGELSPGETLEKPEDPPVGEDRAFEGWRTAEGEPFDGFGQPVAQGSRGEIRLCAEIKPKRYTVTYQYEGDVPAGAPELPIAALSTAGQSVAVAADPTLEGYTFSGWAADDGVAITDGAFVMPAHDVTLRGSWTPVPVQTASYQVRHYLQDVDAAGAPQNSYSLAAVDYLSGTVGSAAAYSSRSFGGWAYDPAQTTYSDTGNEASSTVLPIAEDGSLALQLYYTRATGGLLISKTSNLSGSYTFGIYTRSGTQYTEVRQVQVTAGQGSTGVSLATGVYFVREISPERSGYDLATAWRVNGQSTAPNADGYVSVVVLADRDVSIAATDTYTPSPTAAPTATPKPDSHPEIGDAIQNGTWGGSSNVQQTVNTTINRVPQTGDDMPVQVVSVIGLSAALGLLLAYRAKNGAARRRNARGNRDSG